MSDLDDFHWEDMPHEDEGGEDELPFETFELDIIRNMEDPPAEAFETSWRQALEILEDAGPQAGILLLTVRLEGDDLRSKVVLSSGYERIPSSCIWGILNTHIEAMGD